MNTSYYTFPALRGLQGDHDYYVLLCPLHLVPRIFLFDGVQVPADWQPRPPLNEDKVDDLADSIRKHSQEYVLAPLVATVAGAVEFTASDSAVPEIGSLRVPMRAALVIQDGQHRRAAIEQLLTGAPELKDNTIAIMLVADPSLDRSPAIFAALNRPYVQGNASRRIAHDPKRPLAAAARRLTEEVPVFQGRVDYERTTISNRSVAMFTMNAVYQATQALLDVGEQEPIAEEQIDLAREFWMQLGEILPEWRRVIAGETTTAALRPEYIHVHSVTLLAIGRAGAALIAAYPDDWQARLKTWGDLDWSRKNPAWEGRAMLRGRMSKQHSSIQLTANALKTALGLSLTEKEKELEKLVGR